MARHTSFTCDVCQEPIAELSDLFSVSVQRFGTAAGEQRHADLCTACVDTLPTAVRPAPSGGAVA